MNKINLKTKNLEQQSNQKDKNTIESPKINHKNNYIQSQFLIAGLENFLKKKVDTIEFFRTKNIQNNTSLCSKRPKKSNLFVNQNIQFTRISRSPIDNKQLNILTVPNTHHNIILQNHIHHKKIQLNNRHKFQKINSEAKEDNINNFSQQNKKSTIVNSSFDSPKKNNKILMKIIQFDFSSDKKYSLYKKSGKSQQKERGRSRTEINSEQLMDANQYLVYLKQDSVEKIKIKKKSRLSEINHQKFIHKIQNLQSPKKQTNNKQSFENENKFQYSQQIGQIERNKIQERRKEKLCRRSKNRKNNTVYISGEKQSIKKQKKQINKFLYTQNSDNENNRMINLKGNSIFTNGYKKEENFNSVENKELKSFKFRNTGISIVQKKNYLEKVPDHEEKITPWKINLNEQQQGFNNF